MRAVAVGVAVAALLLGCAVAVWLVTRDPTDHGLGDALAAAHDGDRIELREHVDSDWDRWYAFGPYTPASRIESSLGFSWPDADNQGIRLRDDIALLVFTAGDEVLDTRDVVRGDADLTCLDRGGGRVRGHRAEHLTITVSTAGTEPGQVLRRPRRCGAAGG